jgi:hypothetical protein
MKILTLNKATHILVLTTALLGIQVPNSTINANAQSVQDILRETDNLVRQGNELVRRALIEDQKKVSRMSCSRLKSEARKYDKQGDYWASQVNIPHYAARAQGSWGYANRRLTEYNRRC